jgi:hypothetical protein
MGDLDMRGLAQVLRSAGRRGDTVLAHISPKEARKLKREGGSGTINPVTGLPEYAELPDYVPPAVETYTPEPPAPVEAPVPEAVQTYGEALPTPPINIQRLVVPL